MHLCRTSVFYIVQLGKCMIDAAAEADDLECACRADSTLAELASNGSADRFDQ